MSKYHKRPYTENVNFKSLEAGDIIYYVKGSYYVKILHGYYGGDTSKLNCTSGWEKGTLEDIIVQNKLSGYVHNVGNEDFKMVTIKQGYQTPLWKVLNGEEYEL